MPNTRRMRAPSYARGDWACPHYQPHRMAHPWVWPGSLLAFSASLGPTGDHVMNWGEQRAVMGIASDQAWVQTGGDRFPLQNMTVKTAWGTEPGALYFSGGTTERVACGGADLSSASGIALAAWVKVPAASNFQIFSRDDNSNNARYWQFRVNGYAGNGGDQWGAKLIRFNSSNNVIQNVTTSSKPFVDGEWHHFGAVWDAGSGVIRYYLDGKLDSETSSVTTANHSGDENKQWYLGNRKASEGAEGYIDDVFCWTQAYRDCSQGTLDDVVQFLAQRRGIAFETRKRRTFFIPPADTSESLGPFALDFSLPAVTADQTVPAEEFGPFALDFTLPALTGSQSQQDSIGPLSLEFNLPAITATQVTGAEELGPLVLNFVLPGISATQAQRADISPAVLEFSLPAISATQSAADTLGPFALDLSLPALSATQAQRADISPVVLEFTLPAISASASTGTTAELSPWLLNFALPSLSASQKVRADISPLSLEFTLPAVTSSFSLQDSIDPLSLEFSLPAITAEQSFPAEGLGPFVLDLSLPALSATQAQRADIGPLSLEFTLPAITASEAVQETIAPLVLEFNLPAMAATSPSNNFGELVILVGASQQTAVLHNGN